jgi:hypothetical protein
MIYWFKRKYRQIRNVFRWLPVIWRQYDFDYQYSLEVFKFQLQKQAEFFESDRAVTRSAKDKAKRIRTILKLMDKVYEEDYAMEYVDILKEMYGDDVLEVSFVELNETSFNDFSGKTEKLFSMRYKYETWDNAEEISQIKDELFVMCYEKQERAHKILWKMIEKDIRNFRD